MQSLPQKRKCEFCGKTFFTKVHNKIFCSIECRNSEYKMKNPPKGIPKRKCINCGKSFTPNSSSQKYCCIQCRDDYYSRKPSIYVSYLRQRFAIFDRDGYACRYCGRTVKDDNIKLVIDHIIPRKEWGTDDIDNLITACEECNTGKGDYLLERWKSIKSGKISVDFPADKNNAIELSDNRFKNSGLKEMKRRKVAAVGDNVICKSCGKKFVAKRKGVRYCSDKCRLEAKKKRTRAWYEKVPLKRIHCEICDKIFTQTVPHQKYCSEECKKASTKKKKNLIKKQCLNCGKTFTTTLSFQKYCSKKCAQQYTFTLKNPRFSYLKNRFKIFNRDHFSCQYCGRNVKDDDIKLVIDHRIPLEEGGTDDIDNLITACEECNTGKGDYLLESWKQSK